MEDDRNNRPWIIGFSGGKDSTVLLTLVWLTLNKIRDNNENFKYNRLDSIIYPNHPENNVRYQYGAPGAAFNRAGRLLAIEDGSGRQEFKYGRQGELTELSRTLVIPNQGVANYVTQWQYDSWNRLWKQP